jgi:hypothetical protein
VLPVVDEVSLPSVDDRGKSARTGVAIVVVTSSRRNVMENICQIAVKSPVLVPPVTTVQKSKAECATVHGSRLKGWKDETKAKRSNEPRARGE